MCKKLGSYDGDVCRHDLSYVWVLTLANACSAVCSWWWQPGQERNPRKTLSSFLLSPYPITVNCQDMFVGDGGLFVGTRFVIKLSM